MNRTFCSQFLISNCSVEKLEWHSSIDPILMENFINVTYLTIPNPKLTIITNILASILFKQETSSANITAPRTEIQETAEANNNNKKEKRSILIEGKGVNHHAK